MISSKQAKDVFERMWNNGENAKDIIEDEGMKQISNTDELNKIVDNIIKNGGRAPHLAAVLVGSDGASLTYVGSKVRSCKEVGFESTLIKLTEDITEESLLAKIKELNKNVLINLFITLNFRHDSTEKTILSYDNFNVFEFNFCSRWQIIYPSY